MGVDVGCCGTGLRLSRTVRNQDTVAGYLRLLKGSEMESCVEICRYDSI